MKNLGNIVNDLDVATKGYVDSFLFVGSMTEYEAAYAAGKIAVGAVVIITDAGDLSSSASAVLGVAVLGQMKLGQK